ncbi:MAG TPA: hypothetical protein VF640_07170 [Acidimicrobiales bacterium]
MNFLEEHGGAFESHPPMVFSKPGDHIVGIIVEKPRPVEVEDLNDRSKMVQKLVIDIEPSAVVVGGEADDTGETRTVWVNPGAMGRALKAAMRKVGLDDLAVGGTLAIKHTSVAEPTKRGYNGAKLYEAIYTPPAVKPPSTSVSDIFGNYDD